MKEHKYYFFDKSAIGKRIKAIRESFDCTMEQFGRLVGTTKVAVYNWETGKRFPSDDSLEWIALLGKKTVEWIIYGDIEEYVLSLSIIESPIYTQVKDFYTNHHANNSSLFERYEKATTETRTDIVKQVVNDYARRNLLIYSQLKHIFDSFMSTMEDALSKQDTVELPDELKNSLSKIKKKNLSEKGIDSLLESIRAYLEY
ncbi:MULTISPECIES: helix-turn-helix domain-containing protein [Enterococcus]|uniref:helix-turn-helix domain-containing protein n=1 Tax=Enterococcus TaxID=1350 RepID=UPI0010261ECA|nr:MULTISPECIES: helix-turn-helix domain-containing protein [Enterococcus]MDK4467470.1 helix-turn-helix domain-containing protein [Enterococcus hirae]UYU00391.1 helix-turn-helix domain-containing protein [Enterococcus hirae]VFA72232.1 helix-turn-helix domain-containing protein [Enterococcus faecium]